MVVDAVVEGSEGRQQRVEAVLQGGPPAVVDAARARVDRVLLYLHGDVLQRVSVEATLRRALGVEDVVEDPPVELVYDLESDHICIFHRRPL